MTRRQLLARARELLTSRNIPDAPLEAELLLRHVLQVTRAGLLSGLEVPVTPASEAAYLGLVERRAKGEPSAYITGQREFYGLDFELDCNVLIPRPETELLVEQAIRIVGEYEAPTIADVGTGCGAIAISLTVNLPQARVYATDVSSEALAIARRNAARLGVMERIIFVTGDLLEPQSEPVDVITANLPYVRSEDVPLVTTAGYEPRLALDGGPDGLDFIRRICAQAEGKLNAGGSLLLEIGMGQAEAVTALLRGHFPGACVTIIPDWNGIPRVAVMTLA